MIGLPSAGKTMLAQRLPTIMPTLTLAESLETTRIYSAAGLLPPHAALLATRPVRRPHHSASIPALVGRALLESLRQPLEDAEIIVARAHSSVRFPASFMVVAAMNPCPCGYFTDPRRPCKCTAPQIDKYLARISGPLLDRIDIHLEVPAVRYQELRGSAPGTSSDVMREQVQQIRFGPGSAEGSPGRQRCRWKPGRTAGSLFSPPTWKRFHSRPSRGGQGGAPARVQAGSCLARHGDSPSG